MSKLTRYLKDRQITQKQFAEAIGIHQTTVSRLCDRTFVPSLTIALKIEEFTGGAVRGSDLLPDEKGAA
jgi:DNA-binding XRE family transcriptional regulator